MFLGFIIMRTDAGFAFFDDLGGAVGVFLDYSDVGAAFLFGIVNSITLLQHYYNTIITPS
jgi:nucleoside permease NupC